MSPADRSAPVKRLQAALDRLADETRGRPRTGLTATASGDCCTPALPWRNLPVTDFLGRYEEASTGDFTIHYLSRPDLIQMRRAVGRIKDLRRAAELHALP